MPIYHFHLCDGFRVLDPRGLDLPDAKAAAHYGLKMANSLSETARDLGSGHPLRVHVTDESGKTLGFYDIPEDGSDARDR
jgi:hypothetical protein